MTGEADRLHAWKADVPLCKLELAVGRRRPCPEDRCPFWEPGGAVLEGRCAFEQVSVEGNRELAELLLRVRRTLSSARSIEEREQARLDLGRILDETREG
jgi:hypothetical protein